MAELYDTTRFGELFHASRSPPVLNLGLAARYISDGLSTYRIPYAMIGGWAIYLRGSGRQTQDVDVTVAASMDYLKQVLLSDSRTYFPAAHGQTCVQVFIKTGRSFDVDYAQTSDIAVSMDIVISGNLGTPLDLSGACEQIIPKVAVPQGSPAVVLDLFSQVSAKLIAFSDRGGRSGNDFRDLVFLLSTYGSQISSFRDYLDAVHRQSFAQKYATTYAGSDAAINSIRQILGVCLKMPASITRISSNVSRTYYNKRRKLAGDPPLLP